MKSLYKALLGNEFIDTNDTVEIINPFTRSAVTKVTICDEKIYKNAIEIAKEAQKKYIRLPQYERSLVLLRVSEEILKVRENLARIITLESGKPIKDSRAEVDRAAIVFRTAFSIAEEERGEFISLEKSHASKRHFGIVKRVPLGVGIGITPFNFPLNLVAHKIAPALLSGNAIIIKPALRTPVSALMLADILNSCGLYSGMLSVLPARSLTVEKVLKESEDIRFLSFTGSANVGWYLKSLVPKKKVVLELGGNAGVYIDSECDVDFAAKRCVYGAFAFSGQICISVQRIFVYHSIFDKFLNKFLQATSELKLGDPLSEHVDIGPMIDVENTERVLDWIEEAKKGGARVLTGGEVEDNILKPTVITDSKPEMKINSSEVFGPVVTIEKVGSFEEGIEMINNSIFGLQAGVFTNNLNKAFYAYENIEVGGVIINDVPTFRSDNMPYGGVKESGFGREGVRYAAEELTEPKLMVVNLNV
ncbi:MAG: aldehyde dehydrogenase family protein [Deltaproteobacteria bacterium]|nr:aldehyde dehydrogenase family protein [Deltaproteobacteria bacterium]